MEALVESSALNPGPFGARACVFLLDLPSLISLRCAHEESLGP